ncbi:hypothetical protein PINS_up011907 [Pythium insidiosum]|nr:hypothetical protein PINS_up011907 [Pythium insidiosum]
MELFERTSDDILTFVLAWLDLPSLLALDATSRTSRRLLAHVVELRCKRECLSTYIYPTIATYRIEAPVPESWRRLYAMFSSLRRVRWDAVKQAGTSSTLRALRSDNQEYSVDHDERFLLRYSLLLSV